MHQPIAAPAAKPSVAPVIESKVIQKCGCEHKSAEGGECDSCKKKKEGQIQRAATDERTQPEIPGIVQEVLQSKGEPLDTSIRHFMEPRFGHDFSRVRVHADTRAGQSAQAINALAYTSGEHIVFAPGRYQGGDSAGRQLIAHELTHTIQQQRMQHTGPLRIDDAHSAYEQQAHQTAAQVATGGNRQVTGAIAPVATAQISRADPGAVGYTMRLGNAARSGIRFFPNNVTDTVVGPVTIQGGLLNGAASRLNVIVAEGMSIRRIAREILPLWLTATPFTPPGAASPLPLDRITDEELAQALLVYNEYYLPVPAMTNWRAGVRLPLPVEIDDTTHIGTLHPLQIRALAGGFTAAMQPALDMPAAANAAQPAATVQANAAAFLASHADALSRGIHLNALALTNAVAAQPLITEVFRQLGASGFDVALEFANNMVLPEARLLAAQRDGAVIIRVIQQALALMPATPTTAQQEGVTRAGNLFGGAGTATAPPDAARTLPEKTITIDTLRMFGATADPANHVAFANAIYSQCNVRVVHGVNATATQAQTNALIGDTDLATSMDASSTTPEATRLFRTGSAMFGLNARYRAFFVHTFSGIDGGRAYSTTGGPGTSILLRNKAVVQDIADAATLAHELGHIIMHQENHDAIGLMSPSPTGFIRQPSLTNAQCTTFYNNA
ncbi:protein of unknown function [Filimonas lacunae]|uniref:eCIS core domain-containing protein n=1 Tax=Filimonas lacunae TaxID=477680 RepID=A0A173MGP2_9BACT|nr:DUF4157 domain-containing protein [Filimonas lacunae]BAV06588.1 hypothetical protein FLA_2607 [Filimonas lacunae]SIT27490.1 protein of unknown function [Filimonas lacunae]